MPVVYPNETNLFTKHFVMGCKEERLCFTKTHTEEIQVLHSLMFFKDHDWAMERYSTKRTQYIDLLCVIDLEHFEGIVSDLAVLYRKEYPFSKTEDFIQFTFGYTLFELRRYLEFDFTFLSDIPHKEGYNVYNYFLHDEGEFIDVIIDDSYTIDYYKQYYQRVIEIIEEFDYSKLDEIENLEIEQNETKRNILVKNLQEYGFYSLKKVKSLPLKAQTQLIDLINYREMGYKVAMLEYLDYFSYLQREYFNTKAETNRKVSSWFGGDNEGRNIRGQRTSIVKGKPTSKGRYNGYQYEEQVQNDYEQLKRV